LKLNYTLNRYALIALIAAGISFPGSGYTQCSVLKSISYNSTIAGTGNQSHSINIPQFDPSKGTLVAVKITSVISLQYGFQLENNNHAATSYSVTVGRNDYIGSTALSSPLTNMNQIKQTYGPYALAASDGVAGSGPDFIAVPSFSVLNNFTDISDSLTGGIGNFLGTGTVNFSYYTTTYNNITGNYTFTPTSSDVINFSVSYYYCNTTVLNSNIVYFDAKYLGDNSVNILWQTANEQPGRIYNVEKSNDGAGFDELGNVNSNQDSATANYQYNYKVTSKDGSKIYFRLKIVDTNNSVQYSDIISVSLSSIATQLSLYPNPSNSFINVVFDHPVNNWQIGIFTADGAPLQTSYFANTNLAHIGFINKLAPGVYFIRAFNKDLNKNYVLSFMVQ
jgi:hypothetical protein